MMATTVRLPWTSPSSRMSSWSACVPMHTCEGRAFSTRRPIRNGREGIVLNVPRYDFNWQVAYGVSLKLPKGSRLHFEFRYDNSANNKNNPDPSRWVYQGFQSWEEMMAPDLGSLLDRDADVSSLISVQN